MKTILLLITLAFVVSSCETTSVEGQAQQITLDELNSTPGYAWFPAEMTTYAPSQEMVDSVNTRFKTSTHKICIFVKPACSCRGTQKLFPQVMKTITESNIPMDNVEIWSMRSTSDLHPYMADLEVTDLPIVFILENDVLTSRILDADYNSTNADTLLANSLIR